ncbi:hypothetical protein CKO28_20285 [Rhodovibrio sodomensis]|uniref:Phosphatidate cytidylyltransferase n=1 Tax=Rhodovibrio sodomensis TaxID=1088 RepID=A0ABS1DIR2_9PROT|nr:hypothetical protein [Rhodovibrio sodomensis]
MSEGWTDLRALVAEAAETAVDAQVRAAVDALLARCRREQVVGVLFYGSSLWAPGRADLIDLYLLVDTPSATGFGPVLAGLNRLLPPNVIYLETTACQDGTPVGAKVAVVTWTQFARGTAGRSATPAIWARFAQPCRLVYARDEATRSAILDALTAATVSFHRKLLGILPDHTTPHDLWQAGLTETYARELRSEAPARARAIVAAGGTALTARTPTAIRCLSPLASLSGDGRVRVHLTRWQRGRAQLASQVARPAGKVLSLARAIKATFTFDGGVDYVCAKIERHSGVAVRPTPFQRRHPLIGGWPLLWRIYRAGGLR